ncbi:hypothetical protein E4L96_12415 [Massilia arenosa]|uniref:Cytochrome P450 n=1 Tax=Zemynaea arenosa TaxID=2561931 RepID=A0A4Y9SEF4_9BURK|nr:hypothetical protein [Massilia arenosa]TFW19066.1 hypothetical protein E4L96_12415 [Massilia arenosa]
MAGIPWARGLDDSAALLLEGYEFGRNRFRQLRSDIFATRLMAQPAIVMMGEEAAWLFCDNRRFVRHGALPHRVVATLVGRGGVQGLDDEMHAKRKQLMLTWLMAPDRIEALAVGFRRRLHESAAAWAGGTAVPGVRHRVPRAAAGSGGAAPPDANRPGERLHHGGGAAGGSGRASGVEAYPVHDCGQPQRHRIRRRERGAGNADAPPRCPLAYGAGPALGSDGRC